MKAIKTPSNRRSLTSDASSQNRTVAAGISSQTSATNQPPPISPPTTVELRGIPIHFPFRPYACQQDYMEKVLDALFRSENALLESPTGTGKTLCLLCATLAWQREEARKLYQHGQPAQVTSAPASESIVSGEDGHALKSNSNLRRVPTIIYASRTHSQLSQVVRELRNTRYRPKHAVLGSREQMCVNPKVKRAGATGADINHDCSRLAQERKCSFRNKLEGFVAPSNEGGASTQSVRDMEELVQLGQDHRICPFYYTRNLVEDAELILLPYNYLFDKDSRSSTLADVPWNNAVVIFDEAHNLESFASESASFDLTTTDLAGCINEIQRAVNYVQTFGTADESGSGKVRPENIAKLKSIFLRLEEYILNTLNAQTMSYKGEFMMELFQKGAGINHANHELFIAEVRKLTDIFLQFGNSSSSSNNGGGSSGGNRAGAPRLEHFIQCVKRVFGEPNEARCFAKAQSYRVHITQKQSQPAVPNSNNKNSGNSNRVVGRTVSYWCFAPSEAMRELANLQVRSVLVTSGTLSPLESYALELDLPFPHRLENPHIIPDDQIHVRVVGKGVSNKLLSSAYERRQDNEYYTELGNTLISLAKIIPGGMLVFFPSYGVMETCLEKWGGPVGSNTRTQGSNKSNSFFAARKRRPTGSARYSFPHAPYTYSASKEGLNQWKRLLGVKAVVVEPRSTADLPDAINEFHKYLSLPKSRGVALFGVCRGKISEGIDFAHDMCRAVVITGLPFAPSFDPKIKMKREFLDQNRSAKSFKASTDGGFGINSTQPKELGLSGHEWYTQQAHRAVNQAIGRVIRNKNDYGAVLLLDNRFSLPANQQGLSKWIRPHILPDEGMGRTIGALSRFYKEAAKKAEERAKSAPMLPAPSPVSIILRYEDEEEVSKTTGTENQRNTYEDEDMDVTKIAYVERGGDNGEDKPGTARERNDDQADSGTSYIRPDRIIARVDMKKDGSKGPDATRGNGSATSTSKPDAPMISSQRINSSEGQKTVGPLSPAQRFFQLVQERMTKEEQSTMRQSAVAMKPVNGKYGSNFVNAARNMIRIMLRYEPFEERSQNDKPEMIKLLIQLFPKKMVHDVHRLIILMVFDESGFAHWLKDKLDEEVYLQTRSDFKMLLIKVWFKNHDGEYLSAQDFLSQLEKILSSALGSVGGAICSQDLVKLVPLELKASTTAFLEQATASLQISKLKAKEKASTGESSVLEARFRVPASKAEPAPRNLLSNASQTSTNDVMADEPNIGAIQSRSNKSNPYASSMRPAKPKAVIKSTGSSSETTKPTNTLKDHNKAEMPNPYARKSAIEFERPAKMTKKENSDAKFGSGVLSPLIGSSTPQMTSDKSEDQILKALDDIESDMYMGQNKSSVRTVVSNAPKDWMCTVCEKPCNQPFIAPCHHLACKGCWVSWLKRSETCPHCRKSTSIKSLALVVFKEKYMAATFSQA